MEALASGSKNFIRIRWEGKKEQFKAGGSQERKGKSRAYRERLATRPLQKGFDLRTT